MTPALQRQAHAGPAAGGAVPLVQRAQALVSPHAQPVGAAQQQVREAALGAVVAEPHATEPAAEV